MLKIKYFILNQLGQTLLRVKKNPGSVIFLGSFTFFLSIVTTPHIDTHQTKEYEIRIDLTTVTVEIRGFIDR